MDEGAVEERVALGDKGHVAAGGQDGADAGGGLVAAQAREVRVARHRKRQLHKLLAREVEQVAHDGQGIALGAGRPPRGADDRHRPDGPGRAQREQIRRARSDADTVEDAGHGPTSRSAVTR